MERLGRFTVASPSLSEVRPTPRSGSAKSKFPRSHVWGLTTRALKRVLMVEKESTCQCQRTGVICLLLKRAKLRDFLETRSIVELQTARLRPFVWGEISELPVKRSKPHLPRLKMRESRGVKGRALEQSRARFRSSSSSSHDNTSSISRRELRAKNRAGPLSQPRPAKP